MIPILPTLSRIACNSGTGSKVSDESVEPLSALARSMEVKYLSRDGLVNVPGGSWPTKSSGNRTWVVVPDLQ